MQAKRLYSVMGTRVQEMIRHKPLTTESARDPSENANIPTPNVRAVEIRLKKTKKDLEIGFNTKDKFSYSAEFLRVESPSAEVQSYGPTTEKKLVFGKKHVQISAIEPVGNYAVKITFSDGHDTGIYSWKYLYTLGKNKYTLQKKYILALRLAKRSRAPRKSEEPVKKE